MAKSNSFSKREIEKKKAQKRKEKQQRREERKESGADSFEDMIAYVDEFGMITDTPPEPLDETEEIELENIEISTPKMEVAEEEELKGHVRHFNASRGFGFIKDLSGRNEYFFHISNAPADIDEGDLVTYELERGDKGLNAVNVVIVKE